MNFKETQIGLIPAEWELAELKDISDVIDSLHQTPKYSDEGYSMVRVTDINPGYLKLQNCLKVDKEIYELFTKKYGPQRGDIVISRVGSYGIFSYVGTTEKFCLGQNTAIISPKINNEYLYYCLLNKTTKEQIEKLVVGSTQKTLSLKNIKAIKIPICCDKNQKAIAYILSTLDKKIENNNQINKKLEEVTKAIFKHWFVDFEFPNEEGLPYKSSGGEMVDSELGIIPKSWKVVALDDICCFNNETYSSKDKFEYISYLDTSNITENKIDMIQKIDCNSEKVPSRAKRKIIKDSIVYSTVRPNQLHYGIIKKPVENMIVSTGFVVIDSKLDFLKNDLIYLWLTQNGITTNLQAIAETSTSTYPSIKPSDIKSIKIILPNKEILDDISNLFCEINLKIATLQEQNKNLLSIRDTLLPKLMNGEIDISNLEINK